MFTFQSQRTFIAIPCEEVVNIATGIVFIYSVYYILLSRLFPPTVSIKFAPKIWEAWRYLFYGTFMIQDSYDRSNGKPFGIIAPDNRYVFMLQPMYTMHGFDWCNRRGTEGAGFVRALRTLLTNNLPQILPELGVLNRIRFVELRQQHSIKDGRVHSTVYYIVVSLVVLSNAMSFLRKYLSNKFTPENHFVAATLPYVEETLICAEVLRLIPKVLVPIVGGIITRSLKSHETVYNTLLLAGCIQWIMETSPRKNPWTAKRIIHELMAIWFGSVHALSTTITDYADFERTGSGLPFLDSFLKESARLTPVESMSTRRAALRPFTLSDGTRLEPDDWACAPVRAIMTDPTSYPLALHFRGFRFATIEAVESAGPHFARLQAKPRTFTTVDESIHVWGTGRMACLGRYYAVAVMKIILGQIIMYYNLELVDKEASRWFTWRSSMLPRSNTSMVSRPLEA
ncbi:cytochrome P450 [Nemania sp. FL0031]|nr:cytochrome P450 [Nemania sp. FL0031]